MDLYNSLSPFVQVHYPLLSSTYCNKMVKLVKGGIALVHKQVQVKVKTDFVFC